MATIFGPVIVLADSMKRVSGGRPKSTHLHNEMDVREGKTLVTCGLCKQSGHNRRSCPNKNMGAGLWMLILYYLYFGQYLCYKRDFVVNFKIVI